MGIFSSALAVIILCLLNTNEQRPCYCYYYRYHSHNYIIYHNLKLSKRVRLHARGNNTIVVLADEGKANLYLMFAAGH